jgi:ribosomal protein S8
VDDHRAGKIVVELNGRLNKCGVISPRFDVGVKEIEGWTARLLPSRQVSPSTITLIALFSCTQTAWSCLYARLLCFLLLGYA